MFHINTTEAIGTAIGIKNAVLNTFDDSTNLFNSTAIINDNDNNKGIHTRTNFIVLLDASLKAELLNTSV